MSVLTPRLSFGLAVGFMAFDALERVHDDLVPFGGDDLLDQKVVGYPVLVFLEDVRQ
jgi:hypothetical protein